MGLSNNPEKRNERNAFLAGLRNGGYCTCEVAVPRLRRSARLQNDEENNEMLKDNLEVIDERPSIDTSAK